MPVNLRPSRNATMSFSVWCQFCAGLMVHVTALTVREIQELGGRGKHLGRQLLRWWRGTSKGWWHAPRAGAGRAMHRGVLN